MLYDASVFSEYLLPLACSTVTELLEYPSFGGGR